MDACERSAASTSTDSDPMHPSQSEQSIMPPFSFLLFFASDPEEGVEAAVSVLATLVGDEDGSGLRLRAAAMPESESLSLELDDELLELLLLEEDDDELDEDEEDDEEELLLLDDLPAAFFLARFFAFLLWNTHSKSSALSMARASSPRKGNLRSSCCSHRRAMC